MRKEIGLIGLGKMGAGLARNLRGQGWQVVAFNRTAQVTRAMEQEGIIGAYHLEGLVQKLKAPRVVWLMLPSGKPVDEMIFGKVGLIHLLSKGDTIVDGANSYFKDTQARYKKIAKTGIRFIDVGVSGGPGGARGGACIMVGGPKKLFKELEPLFRDLSVPEGYAHFEGLGAGHFVKMVHNGIEYGMMQALAEGFAVLKKSPYHIDLKRAAGIYNRGSVIESRLVGWLNSAFKEFGIDLKGVDGAVGYTGEGEWTVKIAKKLQVAVPILEGSFKFRVGSQKNPSYTGKLLSAMRNQFGGHALKKAPIRH
ncbi:decarboxylating 6-phosphogluconate dehydrogenase [Candidatus Uhrbacteria bacterium]|nr:decarboxylating 6-phosphogluconate dehydrogenase [Candidatus Uhrbacteria bacterium]